MDMDVKILQLNCQGSYAAMCDLGQAMCERGCRFALVQEPYATNGCVRGLPAFMRVFPDLRANSAVIVNDVDVECRIVNVSEQGVCVCVEGAFGKILLCSVYCKFGEELGPYMVYMDTVLLLGSSIPLVLGMDANATSPLWFSKMSRHSSGYRSHDRGSELCEWIMVNRLHVLNEPSEVYTFDGPNGRSDIDVTAVNESACNRLRFRWNVDVSGVSDHNFIEVVITHGENVVRDVNVKRWRARNVDWERYGMCVRNLALGVPIREFEGMTVDGQIECLNEWVWSVNDDLLGRYRRVNSKKVRWWTDELGEMRRNVRRLRRRFQGARRGNAGDMERHRAAYRECLSEYKRMIVSVKEREWREFVNDNRDDPWGRVYGIFRGKGRHVDVSGLRVGGSVLMTWRECVDALLGEFFPRAVEQDLPPSGDLPAPLPLGRGEVADCMGMVRRGKSPGMDGITGEMCKSIWKVIPEYLVAIYNRCMDEGYFPFDWKCARVVVLLKSPDKPRSNPRSYRGISLLPVLGKVLERIMVHRLQEAMNGDFCEWQYGFRKGKCVEDAWLYVKHCVDMSASKYVLGVFVDFKGAFDYLSWDRVLSRLRDVGCREMGIWRSYFSGRRACVTGVNECVWKDVVRGCPQGSICGPFIWNLMMDPLLRRLGGVYKCCAYADDLLILVEAESRAAVERMAQEAMVIVCDWGRSVGVSVAMDKTETMLLKGRLSANRNPTVRVNGVSLRYSNQVKYLGVTMSERMNFVAHVERVKAKLLNVVGGIRRILRSDWGLSRRAVRIIYGGLFVACATYGAPIWYETVRSSVGYRKILSCQRVMLLACVPVCRTVSTDALQVLVGVPPLDLEVIRRAVAFKMKRGLDMSADDWVSDSDVNRLGVRERKVLLEECVSNRWQCRWDGSTNGRVTYGYVRDVMFVAGCPDFGFGLYLGYLLTGHGSMNEYLRRKGASVTDRCDCGGVEDWAHILAECEYYEDIRDLAGWGVRRTDGQWDVSEVVMDAEGMRRLGDFACEAFGRRRVRLGRSG